MIKYRFCINDDCRLACRAKSEQLAWEWLSATKKLPIVELKKLFKLKKENHEERTNDNS